MLRNNDRRIFLVCEGLSTDDVGVARVTIFQKKRPGAGFKASNFVKEKLGGATVERLVDYIAPLPVTPRGNTYILLFTNRSSHRAVMFSVTAAEFIAECAANILVNQNIPL